jgi:hypothetical protein
LQVRHGRVVRLVKDQAQAQVTLQASKSGFHFPYSIPLIPQGYFQFKGAKR